MQRAGFSLYLSLFLREKDYRKERNSGSLRSHIFIKFYYNIIITRYFFLI